MPHRWVLRLWSPVSPFHRWGNWGSGYLVFDKEVLCLGQEVFWVRETWLSIQHLRDVGQAPEQFWVLDSSSVNWRSWHFFHGRVMWRIISNHVKVLLKAPGMWRGAVVQGHPAQCGESTFYKVQETWVLVLILLLTCCKFLYHSGPQHLFLQTKDDA